jgi:hypothetical protein
MLAKLSLKERQARGEARGGDARWSLLRLRARGETVLSRIYAYIYACIHIDLSRPILSVNILADISHSLSRLQKDSNISKGLIVQMFFDC